MSRVSHEALVALIEARHADTVMGALGMRYTSYDPDAVTAEVEVGPKLLQHAGIVHGGVYVVLAESVASAAAALSVDIATHDVNGMEINANHLRAVSEGSLKAVARPIHRGRTTHVYGIEVFDDRGRQVSVCRCTMAIRPRRSAS